MPKAFKNAQENCTAQSIRVDKKVIKLFQTRACVKHSMRYEINLNTFFNLSYQKRDNAHFKKSGKAEIIRLILCCIAIWQNYATWNFDIKIYNMGSN